MSTAVIVVIVVVVVLLVALALLFPRLREHRRLRRSENELEERREHVVGEHRGAADERAHRAELAERRARIAEQEATQERAEARAEQERAELHERGLADQDLVGDHERDKFAGTSAVQDESGSAARTDRERGVRRDRAEDEPPGATR